MLKSTQTTVMSYEGETGVAAPATGESSHHAPPRVSIVIPCFNEERFIGKVLENLTSQYGAGQFEIVVVDGASGDRTREVVSRFIEDNPQARVRLVDNPARQIPAGLNRGIEWAEGDIIVRVDAHSVPAPNYVRRCVEILDTGGAEVCGMPLRIEPGADTAVARSIALAVAHPFGIGDAKYRRANLETSQFVDTVPFGAFSKRLWREVGGFDESLLTNEDYDFYYRVRRQGGRILLDASGYSTYFARGSIKELAAQYFRYGWWKAQMIKMHPASLRLRQVVAPLFVASLVFLTALSLWWRPALWPLLAITAAYMLLASVFALRLSLRRGDFKLVFLIPLVFFVIHTVWGSGFLLGLARSPRGKSPALKNSDAGATSSSRGRD